MATTTSISFRTPNDAPIRIDGTLIKVAGKEETKAGVRFTIKLDDANPPWNQLIQKQVESQNLDTYSVIRMEEDPNDWDVLRPVVHVMSASYMEVYNTKQEPLGIFWDEFGVKKLPSRKGAEDAEKRHKATLDFGDDLQALRDCVGKKIRVWCWTPRKQVDSKYINLTTSKIAVEGGKIIEPK